MQLKTVIVCVLVISLLSALGGYVAAESSPNTVELSLYKNSGFGGDYDINGQWTINAATSQNVTHVEFYLDNQMQRNDTVAPFSWFFDTASYSEGTHVIDVTAYDANGESASASIQRNFVGFPIMAVVGVVLLGAFVLVGSLVFSWYWIRKKAAQKRRLKHAQVTN